MRKFKVTLYFTNQFEQVITPDEEIDAFITEKGVIFVKNPLYNHVYTSINEKNVKSIVHAEII
jgi:citrate lyase alpha subunit